MIDKISSSQETDSLEVTVDFEVTPDGVYAKGTAKIKRVKIKNTEDKSIKEVKEQKSEQQVSSQEEKTVEKTKAKRDSKQQVEQKTSNSTKWVIVGIIVILGLTLILTITFKFIR